MTEKNIRDWSRVPGWSLTAFLAAHLASGWGSGATQSPFEIFVLTVILSVGWAIIGAIIAVGVTLAAKSRSTTLTPFWNMRTGPSLLFLLGMVAIIAMKPFHNELPMIVILLWMAGNGLMVAIAGRGREDWGKNAVS